MDHFKNRIFDEIDKFDSSLILTYSHLSTVLSESKQVALAEVRLLSNDIKLFDII